MQELILGKLLRCLSVKEITIIPTYQVPKIGAYVIKMMTSVHRSQTKAAREN